MPQQHDTERVSFSGDRDADDLARLGHQQQLEVFTLVTITTGIYAEDS